MWRFKVRTRYRGATDYSLGSFAPRCNLWSITSMKNCLSACSRHAQGFRHPVSAAVLGYQRVFRRISGCSVRGLNERGNCFGIRTCGWLTLRSRSVSQIRRILREASAALRA
jgi:hypothetical protein